MCQNLKENSGAKGLICVYLLVIVNFLMVYLVTLSVPHLVNRTQGAINNKLQSLSTKTVVANSGDYIGIFLEVQMETINVPKSHDRL